MKFLNLKNLLILLMLPLMAVQPASAQGKKTAAFLRIEGYKPKPNAHSGVGQATHLFSGKKQFDALFEKVPGAKGDKVNFDERAVVACLGSKTSAGSTITLEKMSKKEGVLELFFKSDNGKKQVPGTFPFCLYNIPVDRNLNGIRYYLNGKLLEELLN